MSFLTFKITLKKKNLIIINIFLCLEAKLDALGPTFLRDIAYVVNNVLTV